MNFIFRIKCLRASGGNSSAAAVEYKTLKYPQRTCGQDSLLGLIDAKFLHVSWCKENVGKECKSDKKIVIWRKGCLSAGGQQKAGWYWRCGRRPYSFCDVLWHTDGSWHNTDRLILCSHTHSHSSSPKWMFSLCSRFHASVVWLDRQTHRQINLKNITTFLYLIPLLFF